MKKLVFTLLVCLPLLALSQEKTVTVGSEEYTVLKETGDLNGYHVKFLSSKESGEKYTKTPGMTRAGGGTSDACNPWIQPNDFDDPNYPLEDGELYDIVANNCDDCSNGPYVLPFQFCFYGEAYDQVYINNNGNLSFGTSYGTFTPAGFPSANYVMIAPFWGDVNMAAEGGDCAYTITETAMYVNWIDVGYYGSSDDLKNSFQVIITNGSDPIVPGGNNVSFTYLDMQWTTGTASGGVGGFGGSPAQVGANKGDGTTHILFGQFSVDSDEYDGPFGDDDGVHWLDYKYFVFNTCTDSENVAPIYEGGACTDLVVCQGGAINLDFLAPEEDQLITVEFEAESEDISVSTISYEDGTAVVTIGVTDDTPPGFYEVIITATDDFELDPGVTQIFYNLEVVEDDLPPVIITGPEGVCPGEVAELTLQDADTYGTIQWSTGSPNDNIFVTELGLYSLTASTEICLKYGEFELVEYPGATPIITPESEMVCEGGTTTLTLGQDYPTITWDFNPSLNTQSVDLGAGTHLVNVVTEEGCTGTASITLGTFPTTELDDGQICGNSFEVVGSNNINGTWNISGPGSVESNSNPNSVNTTVTVTECGAYNFIFVDECNIEESISVVYLNDQGFTIEDMELCVGDETVVVPAGCNANAFSWSWNDGTSEPFLNLLASIDIVDSQGNGTIGFSATNECGTYSDEASILVVPCTVEVPNVFTPNGDGTDEDGFNNDYFVIESLKNFPEAKLSVYNRWGSLIYENDNYQPCNGSGDFKECWSPSADEAPDGTYYYILDVKKITGEDESFSGYLQILR